MYNFQNICTSLSIYIFQQISLDIILDPPLIPAQRCFARPTEISCSACKRSSGLPLHSLGFFQGVFTVIRGQGTNKQPHVSGAPCPRLSSFPSFLLPISANGRALRLALQRKQTERYPTHQRHCYRVSPSTIKSHPNLQPTATLQTDQQSLAAVAHSGRN